MTQKSFTTDLLLVESRARREYICPSCEGLISRGSSHFVHRSASSLKLSSDLTHWCRACILAANPFRSLYGLVVPLSSVLSPARVNRVGRRLGLVQPVTVRLLPVTRLLIPALAANPSLIHQLTPSQFEDFVCDRLFAMGMEPRRVGLMNQRDGGVDVVFWPRDRSAFPFLGAAQVKHHRNSHKLEGPAAVRELAAVLGAHPFHAGLLVTNTTFTPDAKWFAAHHAQLIRLRDFADIQRWLRGRFDDDAEWREIPNEIELCPGVVVHIDH